MHLRCGKSIGSGPEVEQEEEAESLQKSETRGRTPSREQPDLSSREQNKEEDDYEDRGDFALRQENYVRPNFPPLYSEKPPAPFPEALRDTRRPANDKDLFDTFSKCEVNIPLLKLVKSIPRHAKFLKELCKIKEKSKAKEEAKGTS